MPTIQELRDQDPDLQGLDDSQVVDVVHQAYYPDLPREDVAKALGVTPPPPPPPERTFWRSAGDAGISAVRGAVGAVEAGIGLADIPTGGAVGKTLADGVGIPGTDATLRLDTKAAKEQLGEWYSDAQKAANQRFEEAGKDETTLLGTVWEKAKAAVKNPSVMVHSAIESLPSMVGGGVVARGAAAAPVLSRIAAALGPELAPLYFGALGEGVVGAGSAAEQIRQETKDGRLTGQQAGLAIGSGAVDTLFGVVGGKVAKRLGIGDVDTMLAGAASNPKAEKHIARQILEGFISEGALEELPQSIGEQVMQNLALGEPLDKDVAASAVMGFFTGGLMGGGANLYHGMAKPKKGETPPPTPAPSAAPAPAAAAPTPVKPTPVKPTPQDVMNAPDVDSAIDAALKGAGVPAEKAAAVLSGETPDPFADVPVPVPQGAPNETIPPVAGSDGGAAGAAPAATGASTMFGPAGGAVAPAAPAPVQPGPADEQAGVVAPSAGAAAAVQPATGVSALGGGNPAGAAVEPAADAAAGERPADTSLSAAGRLTPEALALRLARAEAAIGEAEGRLKAKDDDANRLFLADAKDVADVVRNQMAVARQQDGAAWERYEREQQAVAKLDKGDRVQTPDGPGTILRKFALNWHVDVDGVGRRTLPPGALRPVEGAPSAQVTANSPVAAPAPAAPDRSAPPAAAPAERDAAEGGAEPAADVRAGGQPPADLENRKADAARVARDAGMNPVPGAVGAHDMTLADGSRIELTDYLDAKGKPEFGVTHTPTKGDQSSEYFASADEAAEHISKLASANVSRETVEQPRAQAKTEPAEPVQRSGGIEPGKVAPLYAQRKVLNAEAIIAWAKEQGFSFPEPAEKMHVTIAFSRDGVDPGKVGNTSPAYNQGKITGNSGREVVQLGDQGAIVLKFASPVLTARWAQYRRAGASWDFPEYQPHITISYGDPAIDLKKVKPYLGPIELGPELQEPLSTEPKAEAAAEEKPSAQFDSYRKHIEANNGAVTPGLREQIQKDERLNDGEAEKLLAMGDTLPSDKKPSAEDEGFNVGDKVWAKPGGESGVIQRRIDERTAMVKWDARGMSAHPLDLLTKKAPATPQVPNEPGTKYVLPSFVTAQQAKGPEKPTAEPVSENARSARELLAEYTAAVKNGAGEKGIAVIRRRAEKLAAQTSTDDAAAVMALDMLATRMDIERKGIPTGFKFAEPPAAAPAPEKAKPEVSKNTIVTDDMAAAARARLKAKLGRLGSGVDPEMLIDGVTLAAYHVERGARAFAAYAKAMLTDLGEAARPYLKSWYMGAKYDPRYADLSKEMSSAAFVDEFDLSAISRDTGVQDGTVTATRDLESNVPAEPAGEQAAGVRANDSGRDAGQLPDGAGDGLRPADGDDGAAGPAVGRGERAGAGEHAPAAGAGRRGAGAGQRGVQGAPRADSGAERPEDAGGTRGVAPNAAPTPANQPTPEQVADFIIEDDLGLGEGGQKTKFRANIEAIRIAKDLMDHPRTATPEEQRALAKYVGWGGLAQAFDPNKDDWRKEYAELKDILTPEEYEAARRSTRYAHYTSREIIQDGIYAALRRFGFTGGRVIEGGAGVGNFIGLMPTDMRSAGRVTAVEREPIAATIARALYPHQNVQLADFTEFKGDDGYFDAAVGNPPFASDPQTDRSGRKHLSGLSLHNYFFAKEVDMLREGGVLAQVVTNSFLDAAGDRARKYIAERTKFLGAIRLPNNAFSKNAGTEVTTDIIFLQKRPESEWGGKAAKEDAKLWMEVRPYQGKMGKAVNLNEYFHRNPDMMLGDFGGYGTMYGPDQPALVARPGQDTLAMLKQAVQKLPEKVYQSVAEANGARATDRMVVALHKPPVQEGGFFLQDGKLMQRLPDVAGEAMGSELTAETQWTEKTKLGERRFEQLKALTRMRQTLRDLLAAEVASEPKMEMLRAQLNTQYDAYRKEYGLLGDRSAYQVFDDDPDFPLLLSLEHNYTPGIGPVEAKKLGIKPTKSTAVKAPIFERRVVQKREAVSRADKPEDALNISMAERGRLDTNYIGELLGKDPEDALRELSGGEKPLLFLDPATNEYVLRDAYLSGNVRQKLEQAKAASMMVNVRELEKVQPEDVPAHEITARVGSPWVPTGVYEDFAKELFGEGTAASVRYEKLNSSYATYIKPGSEVNNSNKWGTPKFSGVELLNAILNNRPIKVTYTDSDRKVHTDVEATEMANTKAQEIKDRFQDWLMADPDRSALLVRTYNDTNNNYVTRTYDGSWLTFPGKVPDDVIKFRRHQRNAIARMVQERTVLLDHVVGAGKTYTVIAGNMELKRTGLANKPMVAVPNHLVKQWAADVYRLYPGANVLTATKKDFEKVNRRRFLAKIATGDWDMVIIAHSSFGFIQPGAEFEAEFNQRQVDIIMSAIQAVQDDDGDEKAKKRTVKQLEGMAERLENRIKRLRDKPMDDLLDFNELGVDQLAVDEAHLFKNLMYQTKLQNVAGLGDPAGAQRAYDMYVKTQQIMEKNGRGQGVVFATGTPVSNSLAEKYHMMRYLMPQQMEELGFQSFDAWANTYADVRQHWMQKISGDGFKAQNRMSEFVNVHELLRLFDQVADTVTNDDIKKAYREENPGEEYPLPPIKGGKPRAPVSLDKSPAQEAYMEQLAKRAEALEKRKGPPKKGEDNHLSLMTDARKAAMDIRLVDLDATEREKGGRIDQAADNVFKRYQQWEHVKGTQLVFSDLGTPKKHAAKELKEYQRLQGIIAEATDEVRDRAAYGDERAQEIVDAADDAEKQLDEQGQDWLDAVKAALRGFSVYDDLKDALVERGIPEHQIAFIHDYGTDDQKASLFRKVNAGDIRVLMGSTAKMGAGTNVQERLVALHHLDVPWRPSDVEQREGRIVRQGNSLLPTKKNPGVPGFEVEILAYVTKDTLDMRMWQIQEVKLKVINQLRTRQIERNIENAFEDMEMSASEMQAAATGNMDLLYEIQARNDIKKLEQKSRSFEAQKNDLIGRRRKVEKRLQELPAQIAQAEAQAKLGEAYKAELNEQANAFKVDIDGKEYTDVKAAQEYLLAKTEEKIYTRTVEKDGKKVREELSEADHKKLTDKVDELRKAGKPDDDAELQAALTEATSYTGRAAPIDITLNGEAFTSRDKLREAFTNVRGDRDPLVWKDGGETFNRRAAASKAIRQRVADAVADEKEAVVGSVGPWTVHVEGNPKNKFGMRDLDVWMVAGEQKIEGHIAVDYQMGREETKSRTAEELTSEVLDWASRQAYSAGSSLFYLKHELESAKRTKKELDATEDLTEWPDKDKLTAARARHQEILARLKSKDPASGKPALSQGGESVPGGRKVGELQQAMDDIVASWQRTIPVTVVSSIQSPSVPQAVRDEEASRLRRGGAPASGGIFDGVVYLFADRLDAAKAATVLYHEVLGHAGMRGVFGREFDKHLETVAMLRREDVRQMVERLGLDPRDPQSRQIAAEEVLAYMAQEKPELTLVQRAIALIRSFLRAHVPFLKDMQLSDAEIVRDYILPARRFVEGGGPGGGGNGFSQGEGSKPFYSALSRAMEAVPAKALPVAGWTGAIQAQINKGAVKADEVEWSGVREWLQLQGESKVSKQDVLDYLQANGVHVEEVLKGGGAPVAELDRLSVEADALGYTFDRQRFENGDEYIGRDIVFTRRSDGRTFQWYDDHLEDDEGRKIAGRIGQIATDIHDLQSGEQDGDDIDGTRYSSYTLPGGENYRELLLTLPQKTVRTADWLSVTADNKPFGVHATEAEARATAERIGGTYEAGVSEDSTARVGNYFSSHWTEPNIVAHIRMDDRTDAEGKRVLFVEELQSDWAQEGRRKGFYDPERPFQVFNPRAGNVVAEYAREQNAHEHVFNAPRGQESYLDYIDARKERHGKAPMGPFVEKTDAWLALALKRIVKYAADNGYDRVAFVNGKQSAERYRLSKEIRSIDWTSVPVSYGPLKGVNLRSITLRTHDDDRIYMEANSQTGIVSGARAEFNDKRLEDIIGKNVAEKVLGAEDGNLTGLELDIGGEGMKTFYDKVVPAALGKLLPKVGGGKLQDVNIRKPREGGDAYYFDSKYPGFSIRTDAGVLREDGTIGAAPGAVFKSREEAIAALRDAQDKDAMAQPGFEVTPAMREAASAGLPLFSQRPGFTFQAEQSPLYKHRTATQVKMPAPEVAQAALEKDATARRIMDKGITPADGELVGVRLNVNVLKSTGVAVNSIHRGNKGDGYTKNRGLWGGEVINYAPVTELRGAYFNVSQKAREKIAQGVGPKEPMASVDGNYVERKAPNFDGVEFRFNPKREHLFRDGLGRVLRYADEATVVGNSVFARGRIEYYGEEDVPARAGDSETQGRLLEPGNDAGTPLFSQDMALNNPRDYWRLSKEAVAELHEGTPGKLHWWHKTLGTQYNLAQKSPLYKRVFDNVQDFLQDVSLYATEAANKAPQILPQLDTWRDLLPKPLGGSGKKPLSTADNRAIRAPIFEGTLEWTRDKFGNPIRIDDMRERAKLMTADEKGAQLVRNNQLSPSVLKMWQGLPYEQYTAMVESRFENAALKAGIVWTNTELRNLFDLNDEQAKLYHEFRASVDESITRAALADMIRYVGKDSDFVRDEVMAATNVKEGMDLLVKQLEQLAKDEPERSGDLKKTTDKLDEKARRALELMDKGYAPLMRFGHYTVTVYGNDEETGEEEVKFFGMYESALDARLASKSLGQEFGGEATRIERGTMNEESYKLFAGINPETVELFGEMLGMSETGDSAADHAFQAYLKLARNNRSAMKRLIHRKGTAGFSEDVGRVLAGFTYSTARLTSRNLHTGRIAEAVRDIQVKEKGSGELARQATRLMEYVNNPSEEAQALRGLLFAQYLGGSIASALVNMTQPFQVTMPYLSQFGGIKASVKRMGWALANAWAPTTGDKALDKDLQRAVEEGVVAPQEIHQLMAQAQGRGGLRSGDGTLVGNTMAKAANFSGRLMAGWGKPFATAELFNRRVTFVAAYRTAQEQGIANPFEFAKQAVVETQFLYNKGNRPEWARGALGATLMTFKQYSISYLELVERMWHAGAPGSPERAAGRRAVFFAAGMVLLLAGAGGLPFVEDVEDVVDGVMQRLGYNWNSKLKVRELLQGAFGKAFGGFLEQGVTGLPGAPIDISGRMGLGNLIPGTGIFQKKQDHARDVLEIAGPTGDLFKRAASAVGSAAEGELSAAARNVAPKAMRDVMKAAEMAGAGQYQDDRGYKVVDTTGTDVLAKAIGFQPGAVAQVQDADRAAQQMVSLARTRESEIAMKWAKGIAQKDMGLQQEARRELADWNEKNPETPIRIKLQDVLKRARNMMLNRSVRIEKTAPKEVRQEARRLMQDR